jgi:acyl-ACP thioesterase
MSSKKTYHHRINAQNIDFRKKISLVSLVNLVLGAAGNNADENGFGVLDLMSKNHSWVLSRLVLDMNHIPVENEDIAIETWLQKLSQSFSLRNFRFFNAQNQVMGYGASTWAIINLDTRRPISLDAIETLKGNIYDEMTPIGEPQRLPDVDGGVLNTFRVKYSDIDVNNHANSLHYVRWISDCFSIDFYANRTIRRFEINYMKELTYGDEGEVYVEMKNHGDYYFQIVTREKGIACRARLLFDKND